MMPIHKNIQAQASFWNLLYLLTGQTRIYQYSFAILAYSFLSSYPRSAAPYNVKMVKRIQKKKALKEHTSGYPLYIIAVVIYISAQL
jgi:hypothetical protein